MARIFRLASVIHALALTALTGAALAGTGSAATSSAQAAGVTIAPWPAVLITVFSIAALESLWGAPINAVSLVFVSFFTLIAVPMLFESVPAALRDLAQTVPGTRFISFLSRTWALKGEGVTLWEYSTWHAGSKDGPFIHVESYDEEGNFLGFHRLIEVGKPHRFEEFLDAHRQYYRNTHFDPDRILSLIAMIEIAALLDCLPETLQEAERGIQTFKDPLYREQARQIIGNVGKNISAWARWWWPRERRLWNWLLRAAPILLIIIFLPGGAWALDGSGDSLPLNGPLRIMSVSASPVDTPAHDD